MSSSRDQFASDDVRGFLGHLGHQVSVDKHKVDRCLVKTSELTIASYWSTVRRPSRFGIHFGPNDGCLVIMATDSAPLGGT